ncbi:hypothetical protein [Rhizobacter sp. SG703]|uniref:hypothetical protein n=1 Tax=Rhizobacter sp. SG703 TaxID=2587140 RepID=UPI00144816E5|nr:hypothetical protein [Rhizobacter sp. SG703]NKI97524.1 hypothetical protein [Rhizobacter sp. SG703]
MKVAVIEMRDGQGRKRPRDQVRAEKPVFGYLIYEPGFAALRALDEAPPTVGAMMPLLHHAKIRAIRKGGIMIVGAYVDMKSRGPIDPLIPQAWWVRPVGHGGIPAE